jgi:hypothetical protein
MLNRFFRCAALVLAAAPMALLADSQPSLVQVIGTMAPWTVIKASPAADGKCKIFDKKPEYNALNNITTPPARELKDRGSRFELKGDPRNPGKGKSYWIVFYPSSRKVLVKLEFVKGHPRPDGSNPSDNKTTLLVTGEFALAKWWKGPELTIAYDTPTDRTMSTFRKENFGKGEQPLLTLN